jgi:hypothetical protein
MPKSNHYYSKYGGWRFGQGNASVCSLVPPPVSICICQGKIIRGISILFVGERFHLQHLTTKKNKTSKIDHFSSKSGGSKLEEKLIHYTHGRCIPVYNSVRQENMVRAFCKHFLQCNLDLSTYSTIKKVLKSKQNCTRYRPLEISQKISIK